MAKIQIRCAWCKKIMGEKPCSPELDGKITDGICEECLEKHYPDEAKEILEEEEIMLPAIKRV